MFSGYNVQPEANDCETRWQSRSTAGKVDEAKENSKLLMSTEHIKRDTLLTVAPSTNYERVPLAAADG